MPALQLLSEKAGELAERNLGVGNCKQQRMRVKESDPASALSGSAIAREAWMQPTVHDQHGPRLRSEICRRLLPKESTCFENPDGILSDVEYAVRLHMEVAGARLRVGSNQLSAILDVEADGAVIGMVHPGVGCKQQAARVVAERQR